jgi:toxin YoeB
VTILSWHKSAWEDYLYWQQTDRPIFQKINNLVREVMRDPFHGTGKPEPLVGNYSGYWSRRINKEHRLIYKVTEDQLIIAACRYHY